MPCALRAVVFSVMPCAPWFFLLCPAPCALRPARWLLYYV